MVDVCVMRDGAECTSWMAMSLSLIQRYLDQGARAGWVVLAMSYTYVTTSIFGFLVLIWLVNRQTHIKNTKGSTVIHKQYDGDAEEEEEQSQGGDDDDDSYVNNNEKRRKVDLFRRRKSALMMENYETELDDDDDDDASLPPEEGREEISNNSNSKDNNITHERPLLVVMQKMKLFSYLNQEAHKVCLKYVEYVDLNVGESLFDRNQYDGSLYTVVSGKVRVQFHDYCLPEDEPLGDVRDNDNDSDDDLNDGTTNLTYSCGPGDVVTPLLAMLTGLVREELRRTMNTGIPPLLPFSQGISAVATQSKTRLVRVPPQCFSAVLQKFPAEVHRIAQIIICRLQRVTVQTLVSTLGLRKELLRDSRHGAVTLSQTQEWKESIEWKRLTCHTLSGEDSHESVKRDATKVVGMSLEILTTDPQSMQSLMDLSTIVSLSKGQTVLETGQKANAVYMLLHGNMELGLSIPTGRTSSSDVFHRHEQLKPGSWVGVPSCITHEASLFTVKSAGPCTLLKVPKEWFDGVMIRNPHVMVSCLQSIVSLIPPVVHLIAWTASWKQVEASKVIATCGAPCKSLVFVLSGRLRASYPTFRRGGRPAHMAVNSKAKNWEEFGRGKCLGDVECLTGTPWPCDVYAIRHSHIAVIPMKVLVVIIQAFPSAGLHFARAVASKAQERLNTASRPKDDAQKGTKSLAGSSALLPSYGLKLATIAVVPLTSDLNLSEFCTVLVSSLREIAPTKLMTKLMAREELGENVYRNRNAMHELKMTQLLGDLEENNRLVVYHADPKYTWWSKLCIQQADCILLVANADKAPETRRVEQCLEWAYKAMQVRIDLVVVGQEKQVNEDELIDDDDYDECILYDKDHEMTISDQLNNWSEERPWIAGHHLVRTSFRRHELDFRRMCRRLTGRSIGLVLGGGGARGLAHLGIIRALTEAGVTVDIVGGSSQGAFCGALYAKYPDDIEKLMDACRVMAASMGSMWAKITDLTLPIMSIFCGRGFNRGIRKSFGNARIQDLVINFFCVSVDLQKRKLLVHTKGLLWKYLRASMSLTGYLPPISDNGALLVDGGYLNVCPADVMRDQMGAKTVISVDVSDESEWDYVDYGLHLSGWWLLWNSWNPFVKTVKVPSWGDIQSMTLWVSSEVHRKTTILPNSDLFFKPPVENYGTLDYDKFDELVELGYNYAKPIVDAWVKQNPWVVSNRRRTLSSDAPR